MRNRPGYTIQDELCIKISELRAIITNKNKQIKKLKEKLSNWELEEAQRME